MWPIFNSLRGLAHSVALPTVPGSSSVPQGRLFSTSHRRSRYFRQVAQAPQSPAPAAPSSRWALTRELLWRLFTSSDSTFSSRFLSLFKAYRKRQTVTRLNKLTER